MEIGARLGPRVSSHFVNSHIVNSHLVNSHLVNVDKVGIDKVGIDKVGSWPNGNWRSGNKPVLAIKMYGKTEILSVQISETKHAIQLKFST